MVLIQTLYSIEIKRKNIRDANQNYLDYTYVALVNWMVRTIYVGMIISLGFCAGIPLDPRQPDRFIQNDCKDVGCAEH